MAPNKYNAWLYRSRHDCCCQVFKHLKIKVCCLCCMKYSAILSVNQPPSEYHPTSLQLKISSSVQCKQIAQSVQFIISNYQHHSVIHNLHSRTWLLAKTTTSVLTTKTLPNMARVDETYDTQKS